MGILPMRRTGVSPVHSVRRRRRRRRRQEQDAPGTHGRDAHATSSASDLTFCPAEDYRQDTITNNPQTYCHARSKRFEGE